MTDAMVQQISAALSQRAVLVAKTPGAMRMPILDTPSPPPARRRMEDTAEDVRRDLMGIIENLQKKVDGITVDCMRFQTDIVKRLDENKTFAFKTAQTMVETSAQDVRAGIAKEILDPERFSKHITGHDAPILQPLVEAIMDAKIKLLNANISALNSWVRGRNERDVKVDSYLEDLYAIRPQEGDQVKSAFRTVADELKHLRAMAQPDRDPTGATGLFQRILEGPDNQRNNDPSDQSSNPGWLADAGRGPLGPHGSASRQRLAEADRPPQAMFVARQMPLQPR